MGADLGAFFDQTDRDIAAFFHCQLFEPDSRCQSGRTAANNDNVKLHGFAFHAVSPLDVYCSAKIARYCMGKFRSSPMEACPMEYRRQRGHLIRLPIRRGDMDAAGAARIVWINKSAPIHYPLRAMLDAE
ncbi:MAG: hypothetical protein FWD50_01145 [Betaproteobacteria bacterium]|nr:hypothetical protein [Betaproteobacteria bacterium]